MASPFFGYFLQHIIRYSNFAAENEEQLRRSLAQRLGTYENDEVIL
jgi:hypothetical protein